MGIILRGIRLRDVAKSQNEARSPRFCGSPLPVRRLTILCLPRHADFGFLPESSHFRNFAAL